MTALGAPFQTSKGVLCDSPVYAREGGKGGKEKLLPHGKRLRPPPPPAQRKSLQIVRTLEKMPLFYLCSLYCFRELLSVLGGAWVEVYPHGTKTPGEMRACILLSVWRRDVRSDQPRGLIACLEQKPATPLVLREQLRLREVCTVMHNCGSRLLRMRAEDGSIVRTIPEDGYGVFLCRIKRMDITQRQSPWLDIWK